MAVAIISLVVAVALIISVLYGFFHQELMQQLDEATAYIAQGMNLTD